MSKPLPRSARNFRIERLPLAFIAKQSVCGKLRKPAIQLAKCVRDGRAAVHICGRAKFSGNLREGNAFAEYFFRRRRLLCGGCYVSS